MSLVLDSSATLAWLYPDETSEAIRHVFERVIQEGACVPALWRIEVANSLLFGTRRKRITMTERDALLDNLGELVIVTDPDTNAHVWADTLQLADKHRLTVYDAVYLELALRLGLPLATLDEALRTAAENEGVTLLGR
ncbi:MAG TPA: type II toxin-antitoxin system VapC family toxin [Terracidiphilus sp.]|nr:type II toxin-antitoxin system VapC family toxin [Terracidiphilus sp.]